MNNKSILYSLALVFLVTLVVWQPVRGSLLRRSNKQPQDNSSQRELIINGTEVNDIDRYPYFALMNGANMCGAVLISKRFVLTAAHCVGVDDDFQLGITDLNYQFQIDGHSTHDEYVYLRKKVHPDYNPDTIENDIAIYELNQDVPDSVAYIRLDDIGQNPGTAMMVIGFGDTDPTYYQDASDNLMQTTVHSVSQSDCEAQMCAHIVADLDPSITTTECMAMGLLKDSMMCAYSEGTDSCQGDSGGPLIRKGYNDDPSEDVLVGLVSWGFDCAGPSPGVYAKISEFYDWITTSMCEANPDGVPDYVSCAGIEPLFSSSTPSDASGPSDPLSTISPTDVSESEDFDAPESESSGASESDDWRTDDSVIVIDHGYLLEIWDEFSTWVSSLF